MPRPERAARAAAVTGWGGGPPVPVSLWRPTDEQELAAELSRMARAGEREGVIARGLGRAYGDAAQLRRGLVVQTEGLRGCELDAERGVLSTRAGVSAAELMAELVPRGFVLPVLPGTRHVSIGGMIASDVHGKNHGEAGSLGRHVLALGLLRSDGEVVALGPEDEGFQATLGGMGLTGVIVWARIALRRVAGPMMSVDSDRAEGLDRILELLRAPGGSHRVAWLDLLAGRGRVRGVVTRAEFAGEAENAQARGAGQHAPGRGAGEAGLPGVRATVPAWWPGGLPRLGVRAFNELRFRASPARERGRLEPVGRHMFPLDVLGAWPRLYGPAGFVQYQLAVPPGAEDVLERVLETLEDHRVPCFLAVLKDFGAASGAPLSFPIPGWTLALDLPRAAPALGPALRRCDELVAAAGGRVYLSKDSRMAPDALAAMYPRLEEWLEARARLDPLGRWRSDLGLRLGLVEPAPAPGVAVPAQAPDPAGGAPACARAPAQRVLVLGGSSEIGLAIVRRLALERPVRALLLGRSPQRLEAAAAELRRAGVEEASWGSLDALELDAHEPALTAACERLGGFDLVVLALGVLGGQRGLDADAGEVREVLELNALGAGTLMVAALRRLRAQGHGTLIVLSTVAVERPRASNAVYGAAKAALDALAQGLADSLAGSGVRVLVVRPGFVHTRMTVGLTPAPLSTSAEAVAEATVAGLRRGAGTVWVPGTLRYVFSLLRHLPRPLYRRLPL
jgi:decaprenylphospho-beta-D-ribofuranose 2-oxidase